jgi:hypothetical protein
MLFHDEKMRAKFATNGRTFAEESYNLREITDKFEEIINKL